MSRQLVRHPGSPPRDVDLGPADATSRAMGRSLWAARVGHMEGGVIDQYRRESQREAAARWREKQRRQA